MTSTVGDLLNEHPRNFVHDTYYVTNTDKRWAQAYAPLDNLTVYTYPQRDGLCIPDYDTAFLPESGDDDLRKAMAASRPNYRAWRLQSEADASLFWHSEISNVVLAGWNLYPQVVQTSQTKPLSEETISEEVDATYAFRSNEHKVALAIGEMKRSLIKADKWQNNKVVTSSSQAKLSQELRGYAHKYECPQVFCFDGQTLLLLQFRANRATEIAHKDCQVDCWVIPRDCGATLRYAFYRLLLQGFRRFQGLKLSLDTFSCDFRQFYNGRPLWTFETGHVPTHRSGYTRCVDSSTGAIYWINPDGYRMEQETMALWSVAQST